MKKLLLALLFVVPGSAMAAGATIELDPYKPDLTNLESLKNGAKVFAQYCNSCHSATLMRYNRVAKDLELSEEELASLMPAWAKPGDGMTISMDPKQAKEWFGTTPPDLSVIARARTPSWLYTFLRNFYADESKAVGSNNAVFKDVAMPAVFVGLQGVMSPVHEKYTDENGGEHERIIGVKQLSAGEMTTEQFDQAVGDLVNYLAYIGEPAKMQRDAIAPWVMLFLLVFFVVVYLLKKEYWKDIH